jgi:hypothetical protein
MLGHFKPLETRIRGALAMRMHITFMPRVAKAPGEIGQMNKELVANDCWILGQLTGIRMLERELTEAFNSREERRADGIRQRLSQLNSWLNLMDDALTVIAEDRTKPRQRRAGPVPIRLSGGPLPAA